MEAKLQEQLSDYFSFFLEFNIVAKSTLRECQNYASTINKLIKRCRSIKLANVAGSPLGKFENLQNKLCACLHNQISVNVQKIQSKQAELETSAEVLFAKHKSLRDNIRQADLDVNSVLVTGSPTQPSLKTLLDFAEDTITFASQAYAQIETALDILTTQRLNTNKFAEHFNYPSNFSHRIPHIIQFIGFMV